MGAGPIRPSVNPRQRQSLQNTGRQIGSPDLNLPPMITYHFPSSANLLYCNPKKKSQTHHSTRLFPPPRQKRKKIRRAKQPAAWLSPIWAFRRFAAGLRNSEVMCVPRLPLARPLGPSCGRRGRNETRRDGMQVGSSDPITHRSEGTDTVNRSRTACLPRFFPL
jgi:hypothetical protein